MSEAAACVFVSMEGRVRRSNQWSELLEKNWAAECDERTPKHTYFWYQDPSAASHWLTLHITGGLQVVTKAKFMHYNHPKSKSITLGQILQKVLAQTL